MRNCCLSGGTHEKENKDKICDCCRSSHTGVNRPDRSVLRSGTRRCSQTPVSSQEIRTLNPEPISTPEPTPLPEPAFQEYDITLLALGDNLMHMGIVKTGKKEDGTYDFSFLFDNIRDYLDAADIKVINQETILGGNELGFSGFPRFNSPTETGDAIAEAGFNVVLHATNHAADQGLNGILNCSAYWAASHPEVLMTGITGEKTTASATSSGLPNSPSGIVLHASSLTVSDSLSVISVVIKPGATAFTVIFLAASSFAVAFVSPITPALEAE